MHSLKNDLLQVHIKSKGAELSNMISVKSNTEFIWQADPNVWGSHAPNLFPIIGAMKNGSYTYKGQVYNMPKHGFVRHNDDFKVITQTETKITFQLVSNSELYAIYPFLFEFELTYELIENQLTLTHTVKNRDDKPMYFSLGGHPAFNCPQNYTDYILEFEKPETSESYILNIDSGLITDSTKPVFNTDTEIQLKPDLFNEDALIFKDLKSRAVSLRHKTEGKILSVKFNGFPYLGLWAKPNAPYVCIEPWIGIADLETTNQQLTDKEGIVMLDANTTYNANYSIEIDKTHLV